MTLERLVELMKDHVEGDVSDVNENTTFENLGIDSLDTVEMVMELEDEIGQELELDKKLTTVGELLDFINVKVGQC